MGAPSMRKVRGNIGDKRFYTERAPNTILQLPRKVHPTIGGYNLGDPANLFAPKEKPPEPEAPPPPPDTTEAMIKEMNRQATDRQLRRSRQKSVLGGSGER